MAVLADRETGIIVAIACDGAGSASQGRAGAMIATVTLARCAKHWLTAERALPTGGDLTGWVERARLRISVTAVSRRQSPRDFATTVVMAMSDGQTTVMAHIGDGAVVGRCGTTGEWAALSWPAHGEYASTTNFLTDSALVLRAATAVGAIDRLALLTDGVERIALNFATGLPHVPFFSKLSLPLDEAMGARFDTELSAALDEFLDSAPVCARTDDDKTVIVARLR